MKAVRFAVFVLMAFVCGMLMIPLMMIAATCEWAALGQEQK